MYPGIAAGDGYGCRQIAAGTVPGHTHALVVATEFGDACENVTGRLDHRRTRREIAFLADADSRRR